MSGRRLRCTATAGPPEGDRPRHRIDLRALHLETAGGTAGAALFARSRETTPAAPVASQYMARQKITLASGSLRKSLPIDVLTEPYTGEFQTGHYIYQWPDRPHEPVTLMRVRARITDPAPGSTIEHESYTVRGKAWSGTGPITRVDVSLTGEGDWQPAQLEPARSDHQWQDWSFTWDPIPVGRHTLRARATDAAGNVQPDVPPWNRLGYGNNAIEVIYVDRR